jgi:hypothetical protein
MNKTIYTPFDLEWNELALGLLAACSLGLSATGQQYFSLRTNRLLTLKSRRRGQLEPGKKTRARRNWRGAPTERGKIFINKRGAEFV